MIRSVRFAEKPLQFNGMIMMTLMQTVVSPHVWGYIFLMKFTDRLKPLDSPKLESTVVFANIEKQTFVSLSSSSFSLLVDWL